MGVRQPRRGSGARIEAGCDNAHVQVGRVSIDSHEKDAGVPGVVENCATPIVPVTLYAHERK